MSAYNDVETNKMPSPTPCMTTMAKCSFGLAPGSIIVVPAKMVKSENMTVMDMTDFKPFVNILPFAMCTSPANPAVAAAFGAPMPCTPMIVAPWTPPNPKVMIKNIPSVTLPSICMCAFGGVIQMIKPGQTTMMS